MSQSVLTGAYKVDPETGEILDVATPIEGFQVTDLASAEWVLEKMMDADAEAAALREKLAAITANVESQIRDAERKREFLMFKFGPQLRLLAEKELEGKKTKTLKTAFGKISFRTKPGKWEWLDKGALLDWAKQYAPAAVKTTESVLVSELTDDQKAVCSMQGLARVVDPQVVFEVKTGVTLGSPKTSPSEEASE